MNNRRMIVKIALLASITAALPLHATAAQPAADGKPKIRLIGSGNVGSNLGRVWASKGYQVMFSSRDIGFEPVLVGRLDMGKHFVPGAPLAGEHTPEETRRMAATLQR